MNKILVPTDFSAVSLFAAEVAADIARKAGARLYFLHVVAIPKYEDNYTFRQQHEDIARDCIS